MAWTCPKCVNINSDDTAVCVKCGHLKNQGFFKVMTTPAPQVNIDVFDRGTTIIPDQTETCPCYQHIQKLGYDKCQKCGRSMTENEIV